VLLAVARTGSLAGAADELGYTPSAVSQQIRALEGELRTVVAERHGRGVMLTEPGRVLAEHAQRIVDALGAAEAELEAIAGLRAGVLRSPGSRRRAPFLCPGRSRASASAIPPSSW
jgi:DNA-binding transcriptional LysR family regulator